MQTTLIQTTLIQTHGLARVPWKNGRGTTREIARGGAGPDGWSWRISIADVERDDVFSRFPGCDRTLALLTGDGLVLDVEGAPPVRLEEPLAFARFSGDATTRGALLGGPTTDFNVITRRDAVHHEVLRLEPGLSVEPAETIVLFVVEGALAEPVAVEAGEVALVVGADTLLVLTGDARGLVVRLTSPS